MASFSEQTKDLSEVERWRAAVIAGQFPVRPTPEAMAAIVDAVRLLRKK